MTAGEATMTTMVVEVRGRDLPGRRCGPSPDGGSYDNIHVGIVRRADTIELVPGDAPSARWQFEVTVRSGDDGTLDFGGPFVHGRRGERHLGLRWGTLEDDGTFTVFRAAKLRFSDVDASVLTGHKLQVAQEIYASRQYTVAAIAKTLGVSRASIYRYLTKQAAER
jgi:Family of unknown function (DUF5990)/Helix-turn-helix domain of resolvase